MKEVAETLDTIRSLDLSITSFPVSPTSLEGQIYIFGTSIVNKTLYDEYYLII